MTDIFPTASSTPSAEHLVARVLCHYDLPGGVVCSLFVDGVSHTYRVQSSGGNFYLRVYRAGLRTQSEVVAELDIMGTLDRAGLSVARVVIRRDGERIGSIPAPEGERITVLFAEALGRPLRVDQPDACHRHGRTIARLHQILDATGKQWDRPIMDAEHLLERPLELLEPHVGARPDDWTLLTSTCAALAERLAVLPNQAPAFGICHGDTQAKNVRVDASGAGTLLDFDHACYSWRVWDLVMTDFWAEDHESESWHALLAGYAEERELSTQEQAAIPLLMAAHRIWGMGFWLEFNAKFWGNQRTPSLLRARMTELRSIVEELDLDR